MATLSISRTISLLAEQAPDRPAITCDGRTISRGELDRRTNRLARAYQALGVRQDDLVTIALPNNIEFYEATIATWKLGATPQPVSAKLPTREREDIVELADPAIVVGAEPGSHGGRTVLPAGHEASPSLSDEPLPDRSPASWKAPTSGGSTGRPKIILAGNGGRLDPEAAPGSRMRRDGVQLVPGPLYHNGPFAFSMRGLLHGNHLVVHRRFDAAATLADIEAHRVDWVLLVPTMMHRIMRLPEADRLAKDLSSLETVLHLGAPCPPWLKEAWIEWLGGERIAELYAGTEAQGVTWIMGDEWLEHRGSVGRPIGGSQMKILGPEGDELPPGEVGEVFMRPAEGSGPTYRYIGAEARERDGWESLGDLGWLDEDGYLYLADRSADLILSGGANVYPAEVEAALDEHPLIRSSAVIGLPDDDLGERVHALLDTTGEVGDDELREHLGGRLVRYKVPRTFERVDEPLRDDAGKVRRSALRAERLPPPEA